MSKSKEKHRIPAEADQPPAAEPAAAVPGPAEPATPAELAVPPPAPAGGNRMTDDGPCYAQEATQGARQPARHSPLGEGGTTAGDGTPLTAAKVTSPAEKLEQLQDQLLRLRADFDNFRKRTLREKTELFERANQELMLELLPILDHLHLGLQAASAHQADPAFREGLQLIFDQLMGTLSKWGISPIEAENPVFDPGRFEAVNTLPSATEPEGTVLALVRRGYMLRNKLLRPAQVIVSSGAPPEEKADDGRQTTACPAKP